MLINCQIYLFYFKSKMPKSFWVIFFSNFMNVFITFQNQFKMAACSSKFSNLIDSSPDDDSELDTNNNSEKSSNSQANLTQEQVNRMENNRKRALEIRKAKESARKM
jgi:hypothetical protein